MSVLVVGVSHRSAPVALLEQLAPMDTAAVDKLVADVLGSEHVGEAAVLATCNRLEVYTEVERFHGSVEDVSRQLLRRAGDSEEALLPHLYVHYDDAAVSHLFQVASGLDSMVVGEGQVLGQVRQMLRHGQELGSVGPTLNLLFQQALRVGKRTHAETDIDHAAPSLVTASVARVEQLIGGVEGSRVVVVGAGAMASLAAATVSRQGAAQLTVVNRTQASAARLAAEYGAVSLPIDALDDALVDADLVISCTGAAGVVLTRDQVAAAVQRAPRQVAVIDLALPHDVEPAVADIPGVTLMGLRELAEELSDTAGAVEVGGVREIVAEELSAFLAARRKASVTPTVVALRSMATEVVEAEMLRLEGRLPGLDPTARAEVLHTVRRVADKLLHQPTVRVKELADTGTVSYAEALAELFALDPDAVDRVSRAAVSDD